MHHCTKNYRRWKLVIVVLRRGLLKKLIKLFRLFFFYTGLSHFMLLKTEITVDSKERGKKGKTF